MNTDVREASRRLPAAERRRAILRAALRVFSSTSYAGATTAEIAREAGVSEPVLYRHFASKRALWVACLDVAWEETRKQLEGKIAHFTGGAAPTGQQSPWRSPTMPNLWLQGLTEAGEDPVVRREIRRHMREVHDFVAAALRDGQERGAVPADRDPDAEAWIFISGGLLRSVADRLGGVLTAADLEAITLQRLRWLTGDSNESRRGRPNAREGVSS
jgi:AcrR family transcriptional regulator